MVPYSQIFFTMDIGNTLIRKMLINLRQYDTFSSCGFLHAREEQDKLNITLILYTIIKYTMIFSHLKFGLL